MKPVDILLIAIILGTVAFCIFCIYRSKKKGQKCIGCPHSKTCGGHCDHT